MTVQVPRPAFHPWNKRHALRKKLGRAFEAVLPYVFFAMAALVLWAAFVGADLRSPNDGPWPAPQEVGR